MAGTHRDTENMIEFAGDQLDEQDALIASRIRPLPPAIRPSAEFVEATRLRLLQVIAERRSRPRAA
jgi:hypothetical protein